MIEEIAKNSEKLMVDKYPKYAIIYV